MSDGWRFVTVPLAYARQAGASAISQALRDAAPRTVVIPDAETEEDLERIAIGLMEAEAGGTSVVVRSASTFARIRCGLVSKRIATVALPERANILIVCGSHTEATTRQLERLMGRTAIRPVVVPTDELLMHGEETVVNQAVERLRAEWTSNRFALLASERTRRADHGDMETGAIVMKALTSIVGVLSGTLDAIIAKGGITSAETATVGMKAATANVCGQLQDGISLWKLSTGSGRIIPYAVIPGNVGEDDAILDVAKQFGLEMI